MFNLFFFFFKLFEKVWDYWLNISHYLIEIIHKLMYLNQRASRLT